MNRKILAVLLICPVLVFAADKMMSTTGKKSNPTVKEKINSTAAPGTQKKLDDTELSSEELVSEMKTSITNREDRQKAFNESDHTGLSDDEKVTVQLSNFLKSNVINKLTRANVCKVDLQKSFSRCPSGYGVNVIVKDGKVTNEGWLIVEKGCDYEPMAKFRYDVPTNKIEAEISAKAGFVSLDDYLKLYRTAQKSL
jgi:hypothetical protein